MSEVSRGLPCNKTRPCWMPRTRSYTRLPSHSRWPATQTGSYRSSRWRTRRTGSHRFRRSPWRPSQRCNRRRGLRRRSLCLWDPCRSWTRPAWQVACRHWCIVESRNLLWRTGRYLNRRSCTRFVPRSGLTSRVGPWAGLMHLGPMKIHHSRVWARCRREFQATLCKHNDSGW